MFSIQAVRGVGIVVGVLCIAGLVALTGCANKDKDQPRALKLEPDARTTDPFEAAADRPPTSNTLFAMSRILIAQGKDRDALYALSRIIEQDPDFMPAYNELAELYVRSERTGDAITVLESALRRKPTEPVINNNKGMVHLLRLEYEEALEHFTVATNADPRNPTYRANQAAAYGLLGRRQEALKAYEGIIRESQAQENLEVLSAARKRLQEPREPVTTNEPARVGSGEAAAAVARPAPTTAPSEPAAALE